MTARFIFGFGCLILCAAVLLAVGCIEDEAPAQSAPPSNAKPDYSLDVKEWHAEFAHDTKAAVAKYKDKVVELSGTVQLVAEDPQEQVGLVYLQIEGSDLGDRCATLDKKPWLRLSPGSTVKLRGKLPEFGLPGDLGDADIVETGPNPAIAMTAEQLAGEFAADAKAATDKYDEKWANLDGEVLEKSSKVRAVQLKLKGMGDVAVTCSFSERGKRALEAVKVGSKVKVFGQLSIEKQPLLNACILTEAK